MRQPDADTNGRNLRPVLTPTQGLPSEMIQELAPGLREEPLTRTPTAPLAANEQGDVSDVAETSAPAWRTATRTSASSSPTCRAGRIGRRWPTSSATGRAGRRASGSLVVGRPAPGRNPGTSATRYQGCARPPGPGHRARQPPLSGVPRDPARELPRGPVLGPLLRGGSTVPEDARALEVCDEC